MNDFKTYSQLYHYGIKGMHWGIRRYQNPDGTLTPLGKRHYNEEYDAIDKSYEFYEKDRKKQIAKSDSYLNMDESMRSSKKTQKEKAKKAYAEAQLKTIEELKKAEKEKISSMSYKDLSNIRKRQTGEALATTALGTLAGLTVPQLLGFPYGIIQIAFPDKNLLSYDERMNIINENMKNVTANNYSGNVKRNSTYRMSIRHINRRSRK